MPGMSLTGSQISVLSVKLSECMESATKDVAVEHALLTSCQNAIAQKKKKKGEKKKEEEGAGTAIHVGTL